LQVAANKLESEYDVAVWKSSERKQTEAIARGISIAIKNKWTHPGQP
jgi:hypothetical protein